MWVRYRMFTSLLLVGHWAGDAALGGCQSVGRCTCLWGWEQESATTAESETRALHLKCFRNCHRNLDSMEVSVDNKGNFFFKWHRKSHISSLTNWTVLKRHEKGQDIPLCDTSTCEEIQFCRNEVARDHCELDLLLLQSRKRYIIYVPSCM